MTERVCSNSAMFVLNKIAVALVFLEIQGSFVSSSSCLPNGIECSSSSQCCSKQCWQLTPDDILRCVKSRPAILGLPLHNRNSIRHFPGCISVGHICADDTDCCYGEGCDITKFECVKGYRGTVRRTSQCIHENQACSIPDFCCRDLHCKNAKCVPIEYKCVKIGTSCNSSAICCNDGICENNVCTIGDLDVILSTCYKIGEPCLTSKECCKGSLCKTDVCVAKNAAFRDNCNKIGEFCNDEKDCCSEETCDTDDNECIAKESLECALLGSECRIESDCCNDAVCDENNVCVVKNITENEEAAKLSMPIESSTVSTIKSLSSSTTSKTVSSAKPETSSTTSKPSTSSSSSSAPMGTSNNLQFRSSSDALGTTTTSWLLRRMNEGSCLRNGRKCSGNEECCSNQCWENANTQDYVCMESQPKLLQVAPHSRNSLRHFPGCHSVGEICFDNTDCCYGESCDLRKLQCVGGPPVQALQCKNIWESCGKVGCCGDLICKNGKCIEILTATTPATTAFTKCNKVGDTCTRQTDCCQDEFCDDENEEATCEKRVSATEPPTPEVVCFVKG